MGKLHLKKKLNTSEYHLSAENHFCSLLSKIKNYVALVSCLRCYLQMQHIVLLFLYRISIFIGISNLGGDSSLAPVPEHCPCLSPGEGASPTMRFQDLHLCFEIDLEMSRSQCCSYCISCPKSAGSKCKTYKITVPNNRYSKIFAVI